MSIALTQLAEVEPMQWQEGLLLHPHNQCFNVTLTCYDLHIISHPGHEVSNQNVHLLSQLNGGNAEFTEYSFVLKQTLT